MPLTSIRSLLSAAVPRRLVAGCLAILLCGGSLAAGQSLAEIARREEVRRKRIAKPARAYTNKDVKPSDRPEPVASPQAGPAAEGETAPAPGAEAAAEGDGAQAGESQSAAEDDDPAKQEQQWRARITEARSALERNQMFAEALQSRINSLWADFTARDDPAQRSVIEAERRKAVAQLDRVKAEIVTQTKAIADIEEEARRAGIPPGWLR
jgi:hypothetical protein